LLATLVNVKESHQNAVIRSGINQAYAPLRRVFPVYTKHRRLSRQAGEHGLPATLDFCNGVQAADGLHILTAARYLMHSAQPVLQA
jgi:hypothetical protein